MPKIELSASKGLKQSAGQGFCDADLQTHSSDLNLSTDGTVVQKGALAHIVTDAATITLPKESAGAVKGQIKIIICQIAQNVVIKAYATNATANNSATTLATLNGVGDFAICVFNGTTWVAGASLT